VTGARRSAAVRLRRRGPGQLTSTLALCLLAVACDPRRADLKEWTPEDHHNNSKPTPGTVPADPGVAAPMDVANNVVLIAWKNNCALCHGLGGRGDGPQGRMLQTRDLTNAQWQGTVTDEQIEQVIRTGKGKMPAFQLPEPTLHAIVRLIRSFSSGAASPPESASAAPSAQPADSAQPGASAQPASSTTAPTPSGSDRGGPSAVGGASANDR